MPLNDTYRVLEVVRQAINQETKSGAKVEYSYGQIATSSGYMVSAFLNGNYDSASEGFRVPSHLHVNPGDYAMFAVDHARGGRWLVEVLPNSLYAKLSIDVNQGLVYIGNGESEGVATPITGNTGSGTGSRAFSFFGG